MSQIIQKLTVHSTIEEEIFYPAVRQLPAKKAEDMTLEAYEEHAVVKLGQLIKNRAAVPSE